jgi:enterochelin esterase-like enzyme
MIVVMPSGDIKTNSDVRHASGDVTKFYAENLIPYIDKTFRTLCDNYLKSFTGATMQLIQKLLVRE